MNHADTPDSEEQPSRPRVGRPRRGTALQQPHRRPGRSKRGASPEATATVPSTSASRGRGRKRQRQQAPQPPSPTAHREEQQQTQGDHTSEHAADGHETLDDGGRDEAAPLADAARAQGQAAPAQPLAPAAPQLSAREQARQLLVGMGIPAGRADLALEEAEEQAEGRTFDSPLTWAEQAQFVLACRIEFEEERDQLAEAMDVSLQEEQQRKQAQLPLHERPDREIWQEFCESAVLRALAARASLSSLLAPPLRQPLLDYLLLEKRCKKWYCIARHFFEAQAEQLASFLGEAPAAAATTSKDVAATGRAEPAQTDPAPAPAAEAATAAGGTGISSDLQEIGADLAAVLAFELSEQQRRVQAAVYSMPASSDSAAVPGLFLAAVPDGAEPEVVEVQSDSDDDEGGAQQKQEQQQQQQQNQQQQQQQQQQKGGEQRETRPPPQQLAAG